MEAKLSKPSLDPTLHQHYRSVSLSGQSLLRSRLLPTSQPAWRNTTSMSVSTLVLVKCIHWHCTTNSKQLYCDVSRWWKIHSPGLVGALLLWTSEALHHMTEHNSGGTFTEAAATFPVSTWLCDSQGATRGHLLTGLGILTHFYNPFTLNRWSLPQTVRNIIIHFHIFISIKESWHCETSSEVWASQQRPLCQSHWG